MGNKEPETLESVLTGAILDAIKNGWSYRDISKASGVSFPQLQRFATGVRVGLNLQTVDKLIAHFGIRVGKPSRNVRRPPSA